MNKINLENRKLCKICNQYKPLNDFCHTSRGYYFSYCKSCDRVRPRKNPTAEYMKNWRTNNPDKQKAIKKTATLKQYNLTLQEYDNLLSRQDGKCAICGSLPNKKDLAVDHDHITGKVRGLLCTNCNLILGLANDNPEILENLINYLYKYANCNSE